MKQVRLLVIGDSGLEERLREYFKARQIELVVTGMSREEEYDDLRHLYRYPIRGTRLLRDATPELYDAIIIGHNLGMGRNCAVLVPPPMRPKTMIVWDEYQPGAERFYAGLDHPYSAFGNRYRMTPDKEELTVADFIQQVADQLA